MSHQQSRIRITALFAAALSVLLSLQLPQSSLHAAQQQTLLPFGATWRFLDDGSNQGDTWRQPAFDDSAWDFGPAQLGFGEGDEQTLVSRGEELGTGLAHITTYFRSTFIIDHPADITELTIRLLRDDGAVIHLNGQEILRAGMPDGPIDFETFSAETVGAGTENIIHLHPLPASHLAFLQQGLNHLAVEIHQNNRASSDLSFDLQLDAVVVPLPTPLWAGLALLVGAAMARRRSRD